jgi:hypothetical protein
MERSESAEFNSGSGTDRTSNTTSGETQSGGISDRVKNVGSAIKEKASTIPSIIADGLEAGANALRKNQPASGSTDGTSVAVSSDSSITAVTDTLAGGMQSSADWLRDADLDKIKAGVEQQVKEHPARSLLVALGAGYLIGKALRR